MSAPAHSLPTAAVSFLAFDFGTRRVGVAVGNTLLRQAQEGGSWRVQVSLAGVGHWLRGLGRVEGLSAERPSIEPYLETVDSGFGRMEVLRHAAQFSATPPRWRRPAVRPGTHPPIWPGDGEMAG